MSKNSTYPTTEPLQHLVWREGKLIRHVPSRGQYADAAAEEGMFFSQMLFKQHSAGGWMFGCIPGHSGSAATGFAPTFKTVSRFACREKGSRG
jgi:hypothetical protein